MSTGHMPNPPETPNKISGDAPEAPARDGAEAPEGQPALPLPVDMARILREQSDVLAQQMSYHSQMLLGVSAMGTDVVNAQGTVQTLADEIERNFQNSEEAVRSLVKLATPQYSQVNDRTLPHRLSAQISGLLQGLVVDLFNKAYSSDPHRAREARAILQPLFQTANETAFMQPRVEDIMQSPGPGPNARN
jgi:hypothetical protein